MLQDQDIMVFFAAGTVFGVLLQFLIGFLGKWLSPTSPNIVVVNHIETPGFGVMGDEEDDDGDNWWKKGKPSQD